MSTTQSTPGPAKAHRFGEQPFAVEKKAEITARRLSAWVPLQTGTEVWTWVVGEDMPALPPAQSSRMVSGPCALAFTS